MKEIQRDGTTAWVRIDGELRAEDGDSITMKDGSPISLEGEGRSGVFDEGVFKEGVYGRGEYGRGPYGRGAFSSGFNSSFDTSDDPDEDLQDESFDAFGPYAGYRQQYVESNGSPVVTADGERLMVDAPPANEPQAREEVIRRLEELERLVAPLVEKRRGDIGDNNPPGPIEDPPLTREDFLDLRETLAQVREQTRKPEPEVDELAAQQTHLRRLAAKMRAWIMARVGGVVEGKVEDLIISGVVGSHVAEGLWWLAKTIGIWIGFL